MPIENWMLLIGALFALTGVLASALRRPSAFCTALGAALAGTGFLMIRIDGTHVFAAAFTYTMGLVAVVTAALEERKKHAE